MSRDHTQFFLSRNMYIAFVLLEIDWGGFPYLIYLALTYTICQL